jgi:class 3 adenylate cyclase
LLDGAGAQGDIRGRPLNFQGITMRCSKCGTESKSGRKFCPECGSPLSNHCGKCGADNAPSAKFCEDCGAPLAAAAAPLAKKSGDAPIRVAAAPAAESLDGERKTVTALFAGIKGSTELEQDLDPEEARAIVDPTLKLMIEAVRRYDGYIVQSTGAGNVDYTPIGHTTNLASRMQALAPTGSIAISEQTRKLVEGNFALKPLGASRVKGIADPVKVYEVTGLGPLRTRLQRSAGRGLTKFVGREREMEAMRANYDCETN